jgi:hypoxanthine-DNA glycosylase
MEKQIKMGFGPIYDKNSKVLILGSFPSVKSREISFYYGNKQNKFWRMLCGFFNEEIPESTKEKKSFLLKKGVALWDMVDSCEIEGSADSSIKNANVVDLGCILSQANIKKILLNGTLAYDLFCKKYAGIEIPYKKMPSTSPANPRFDMEIWREELYDVFGIS